MSTQACAFCDGTGDAFGDYQCDQCNGTGIHTTNAGVSSPASPRPQFTISAEALLEWDLRGNDPIVRASIEPPPRFEAFPADELEALAKDAEERMALTGWTRAKEINASRAVMLRSCIATHAAVCEELLRVRTELRGALGKIRELTVDNERRPL